MLRLRAISKTIIVLIAILMLSLAIAGCKDSKKQEDNKADITDTTQSGNKAASISTDDSIDLTKSNDRYIDTDTTIIGEQVITTVTPKPNEVTISNYDIPEVLFYNKKDQYNYSYYFNSRYNIRSRDEGGTSKLSTPRTIGISFTKYNTDDSARPIEDKFYNEKEEHLIKISPEVDGEWSWTRSDRLAFKPSEHLMPNTTYTISLSPEVLDSKYLISTKDLTFQITTQPFQAKIFDMKLYQKPAVNNVVDDPYMVATVTFSYPVDRDSATKGIKLYKDNQEIKIDLNFDNTSTIAFVKSEGLKITNKAGLLRLDVNETLIVDNKSFPKLKNKQVKLEKKVINNTDLPSMKDFFKVNNARANTVIKLDNTDTQLLTVDFTLPVERTYVEKYVKVYKLPMIIDGYYYDWTNHKWSFTDNDKKKYDLSELSKYKTLDLEWSKDFDIENNHAANFFVHQKENVRLLVVIDSELIAVNNYKLDEDKIFILENPDFPELLEFTQDGNILTLSGDKSISIVSKNIEKVSLSVASVDPARVNHLISQIYGDVKFANFDSYNFNEYDISDMHYEDITLNNSDPTKRNYFSINLDRFIKDNMGGIFIIKLEDSEYNHSIKKLIHVTDLGIIVKENMDNTRSVFVTSLRTGAPMASAKVSYLTRNGKNVKTTYTDTTGRADLPVMSGNNEMKEVAILVQSGTRDYNFMQLNLQYSFLIDYGRFNVGGEYSYRYVDGTTKELKSFLFTERGIYRPGDAVHIGMISKLEGWSSTAGLPMQLTITNPRGQVVLNHKFTMNELGFSEVEFQTDYTSPTGIYNMSFSVVNDKNDDTSWDFKQLGDRSFKVEEFKPDTMKISANIVGDNAKGWYSNKGLKLNATLTNLYGTPAQDRDIKWSYTLIPARITFPEFSGYNFVNATTVKDRYITLANATTDKEGKASSDLSSLENEIGFYRIVAEVEGFEAGSGDSVTTSVERTVSSQDYVVGYKTSKGISYIDKGKDASVDYIAINSQVKTIELKDVKYEVIEKRYISTLVRQMDSTYRYQSVLKETTVDSGTFTIGEGGKNFKLPTNEPGSYVMKTTIPDGTTTSISFFVAGTGNLSLSLEKNSELDLTLNKSTYKNGETIELNIISPYHGTGLITIEGDKVYTHKWFHTNTTSTKQSITLPAGIEGNAYVNVSFVRDPSSKEIFIEPHSYAVAPFAIDKSKNTVNISLDFDNEAKPGQPLKITYKVDKNSRVVVYAVDEGVLQVANYRTPNPLSEFFRKRALLVKTTQVINRVLSDNKIILEVAGVGGDYMADEVAMKALAANLNPFKRKTEDPVVFWSGVFDVEANKSGSVTYDVPSFFNGTLRVMVVAVAKDSLGSIDKHSVIKSPIIVQPNMPVVFAPGDKAGITVNVSNAITGSEKDTPITITMEVDSKFKAIGEIQKEIILNEGDEARVDFEVIALDELGSGSIKFKATTPKHADATITVEGTASIRPATAYETYLTTAVSDRADVVLKDFATDLYPQLSERSVTASHNPLLIARGLSAYLRKYPHGCTEQITSQSFPGIYVRGSFVTEKEAQDAFDRTVTMLRARQLSNGGFTMWSGGWGYVQDFATIYALHFLTDANTQNYYVPKDLLANGMKWLRDYTKIDSNTMLDPNPNNYTIKFNRQIYNAQKLAYAAYVLTRNGETTTAFLANFEDLLNKELGDTWKGTLTSAYMAAMYKMLQMDEKANDLIRGYIPDIQYRFKYYSDFDSSTLRNTQYMYLLGKHFPEQVDKIDLKVVLNLLDSVADRHYSSISSSYTILALYALADATKGEDNKMEILMDTINKQSIKLAHTMSPYPTAQISEMPTKLTAKTPERGKLGFFMVATEQGFAKGLPNKVSNGIEVDKKYYMPDGKTIKTTFKQGDDVIVKIRVRSVGELSYLENAAIIDLLPSSLEMQSEAIAELQGKAYSGNYNSRTFDYVDVREDRLVFYAPLNKSISEFTYTARVVSRGEFVIPPVFASAMYDPVYRGNSEAGRMVVTEK